MVTPTPGPEGYKTDCANMTATQLRLAYRANMTLGGRARITAKSKAGVAVVPRMGGLQRLPVARHRAKTIPQVRVHVRAQKYLHSCLWSRPLQMGRQDRAKQQQVGQYHIHYPVHRGSLDPAEVGEASQDQRQDDLQADGTKFCPRGPLELLVGKKSPHLRELWLKLDKLPKSPVGKKVSNPLKLLPFHERHPDQEWPFCEADVLHEEMTGEQIDTEYVARRADHDAIAAWIAVVNAGLPVPALPELKLLKFTPPTEERMAQLYGKPAKPAPAKPKVAPSVIGYAPDDPDDDHDPADCMPDPDEDY